MYKKKFRNVDRIIMTIQCTLIIELHMIMKNLCCDHAHNTTHGNDSTHCCAFCIWSILGGLDVFAPVEVVLGHFWKGTA